MTAEQIMNHAAMWDTQVRTARDCHCAILNVTDYADWEESWVLDEDTLSARGFMQEAMK